MNKNVNIHLQSRFQLYSELEFLAAAISKKMPDFETAHAAYDENAYRIRKLRDIGTQFNRQSCLILADKLGNCYPDTPCGSMTCCLCQRTRRIQFITKWLPYVEENADSLCMVTLVFYKDIFHEKGLIKWDLAPLKQRLRKKLERIGFSGPIIGGFEMDHHFYTHDPDKSHWMPHFHLIFTNDPEKLELLRKYMLRENNLHALKGKKNRPMHISSIQDPLNALSYCVTGLWQEYPWLINSEGKLKKVKNARRIHNDQIFCKSLVKLDWLSNSLLTFTVNVQKRKREHC